MPAIDQVMPWLHLVFDAWEAYKEAKKLEAKMREDADDEAERDDKKKKKKKKRDKKKKK